MPSPIISFTATPYVPTSARTGNSVPTLYRMKNSIVQGGVGSGSPYLRCYQGSEDLSETIPADSLTGTISTTINSVAVVGSGTSFLTELHLGQRILLINSTNHTSILITVDTIADDTHFNATVPQAGTLSGKTAYRCPRLFPLDMDRGTQLWGNAIKFDKLTIQGVGDGELLVNGESLSGDQMEYTDRKPLLAIYDAGTYTVYALGMDVLTSPPTVADVSGGTLGMQPGDYGIALAPYRTATNGFNNPSPAQVTSLSVAGHQFQVTDPGFDTDNGQDAWAAYGTLFSQSAGGTPTVTNSPYWLIKIVTSSDISANTFLLEWTDPMISGGTVISFNNDPPPDSEFIAALQGNPVYVSCEGMDGSSPGPVVVSAKLGNPEAAPLGLAPQGNSVPLSPPRTILGVVSGLGRLYFLCSDSLQIGLGVASVPYIQTKPFWHTGFKNPDQLIFENGTLYGASVSGPTRSIADGDEGSEEQSFAADVEELTIPLTNGSELAAHDPKNNAICFFYPANSINESGFQTTRVFMYGLKQGAWIGDVTLESDEQDMIVSGASAINGHLDFIAGGRDDADMMTFGTYRFDTAIGQSVNWNVTWTFTDSGAEERNKWLRSIIVTGKTTAGSVGLWGAGPTEDIPVDDLADGTSGSLTGSIDLTDTTKVATSERFQVNVSGLSQWAVQVEGTYDGSVDAQGRPNLDQIHEVDIEWDLQGARR
jgi:hypothetical protein